MTSSVPPIDIILTVFCNFSPFKHFEHLNVVLTSFKCTSYPGSSYPVYFNRKHICFFKGPENLFELGKVRVIRVRVIRFPLQKQNDHFYNCTFLKMTFYTPSISFTNKIYKFSCFDYFFVTLHQLVQLSFLQPKQRLLNGRITLHCQYLQYQPNFFQIGCVYPI